MPDTRTKILIVDPDPQLQKLISIVLDASIFSFIFCELGGQAAPLCGRLMPDLVLLNLTLPDMDGNLVISAIREFSQVPIIMLAAHPKDAEVIRALNLGANDFITRPFNSDVLLARVHVALRQAIVKEAGAREIGNALLRIDLLRHEVFVNDVRQRFTPKEYNLLRYFITHRGRMLTHREILKEVWGKAHAEDTQYLRVFVGQVRAKIERNPAQPEIIITEPGVGYRMELGEPQHYPQSEARRA